MAKAALLSLAGALAVTFASPADAAPLTVYDKLGVQPAQVLSDMQVCTDKAAKLPFSTTPVFTPNLYAAVAVGLVGGVMAGVAHAKAMTEAEDICMRSQGYASMELTPDEAASFRSAASREAKRAWLTTFLAKDWSDRIAAAEMNQAKLLPQLEDEPFAIGGVRINPASLKIVSQPVALGQPIVTGLASHRQTATLGGDVEAHGLVTVRFKAGTVLHAVDAGGTTAPVQSTLWCGLGTAHVFGMDHDRTSCLLSTDRGDAALLAEPSPSWLVAPALMLRQTKPILISTGSVQLSAAPTDEVGPMDFKLIVVDSDARSVLVRAIATRSGRSVSFWDKWIDYDDAGRAVLPFWSQRLTLTRLRAADRGLGNDPGDDKVAGALTQDGTGAGWLDPAPRLGRLAQSSHADPAGKAPTP